MAVILRRNVGTALTYDLPDDNFVDYTTFLISLINPNWTGISAMVMFYILITQQEKLK